MKQIHVPALLYLFVFCASCEAQNKSDLPKENTKSETKDRSTSRWLDTRHEYTDSIGASLIIENSLPRGNRYTDPNGEPYGYALFWTRVINETNNPLQLKIDFPADAFEPPWLSSGKYYQLLVLPDTMTIDKEPLYDYGLSDLKSFIDNSIHKPSSLKRTINPKDSNGFYVVILGRVNEGAPGAMRTGLIVKGQDLFYRVAVVKGPAPVSLVSEKEIRCGSISLKNLVLRK